MTENSVVVRHTFFLTEKQEKELLVQAKEIGVATIPEFLDKAIYLAKIYASILKENCELVVVERAKVDFMEDEELNQVALVGPKTSIVFITEKLNEAMQIHKQIQGSNSFGSPIDEYKS